ncbi:hypothetical protein FB45DRAFT_749982 [Roridomyces roridus]|uniref:Uncharacterized protein n=1 Tax=Roridomyces roridus TaxID=1738132 RepID=A0AAD7FLG0_9AGAR|nr:hypothetical protein FB45DRAFT_749982 [Roridomyces roridus]
MELNADLPLPQAYPITKPFSKTSGRFLLAFGIFGMAGFMVLNVFLVGYDIVTITSTNYNTTSGRMGFWDTTNGHFGCQPHQFQLGDSFRTNISAFSYSVFDVMPSTADSTRGGAFSYAANDLSSCDVSEYQIVVTPGDRLITTSASIQCPPPLNFQAVTSWSYSNHDIVGTLVVDAVRWECRRRELYKTTTNDGEVDSQEVYKVTAQGQPNCSTSAPFACTIPVFSWYNAIGNTDLNILGGDRNGAASVLADENNLYNVVTMFFYAVRLDLSELTLDPILTHSYSGIYQHHIVQTICRTQGIAYVNDTAPPPDTTRTSSSVIQIPYTCNVTRRKPNASFAVSVISASLSMFLGAWGALVAILAALARRRPGGMSFFDLGFIFSERTPFKPMSATFNSGMWTGTVDSTGVWCPVRTIRSLASRTTHTWAILINTMERQGRL